MEKEKKKMGRPTDNPKNISLHIRLDEKSVQILTEYCARENVTRVEAVRRGIGKLEDEKKIKQSLGAAFSMGE